MSTTNILKQKLSRGDEMRSYRIALFGTFDVENYGDCLFPLIANHHFTKRLGKIELYPFSPTNQLPKMSDYSRVYAFSELGDLFSEPPSCFVIGGGALLRTEHALRIYPQIRRILYPYALKCWLLPIMIANSWNCPCFLNAVGDLPPFDNRFNDLVTTYLNRVDLCLVRSPFTAKRLSQMNVTAEVVPDSAVSVPHLLTASEWTNLYHQVAKELKLPRKFLLAQASFHLGPLHEHFANSVAKVAICTGLPVVLLPICHHISDIGSLKVMRRILRKRQVKTFLINRILNTLQTSSILANSELYIGTSLHGALVSLAFQRPAVSFSTTKNRGVLLANDLAICHIGDVSKIPGKAFELLQSPRNLFSKKIEMANIRVNDYFDRMSKIIKLPHYSSIPRQWRQKTSTGEVVCDSIDDFEKLKQLCLNKKRELNTWKTGIHYLVSRNPTSQYYDRLMFWLRKRKLFFKYHTPHKEVEHADI